MSDYCYDEQLDNIEYRLSEIDSVLVEMNGTLIDILEVLKKQSQEHTPSVLPSSDPK